MLSAASFAVPPRTISAPPQWSLDSAEWQPAATANASVTVEGLLDGVHAISLKHDYTADGRAETESVDYT